MTPRAKRWKEIMEIFEAGRGRDPKWLECFELFCALSNTYECPRCGRNDLPLYFFHEHNRSCAFECAIGEPPIEKIDRLKEMLQDSLDYLDDTLKYKLKSGWIDGEALKLRIQIELGLTPKVEFKPYSFFVCKTCSGKFETKFARYTSTREDAEVHCEWCVRHRKG